MSPFGLPKAERLQTAIAQFAVEIARLQNLVVVEADTVIRVAIQRESLAKMFAECELEVDQLQAVKGADEALRELAKLGRLSSADDDVRALRMSLEPKSAAWWWRFDELAADADTRANWLYSALAGLLFGLAAALFADVSMRFLKDGPDVYGAFNLIFQAFLAFVTGASFTEAGRRWLDRVLEGWSIARKHRSLGRAAIAFVTLAVAALGYAGLPFVARLYNDAGVEYSARGSINQASDAFRRAIALNPDFAAAHYNLGDVYEKLFQPDRAVVEYRAATLLDPGFGRAQNNLARLLLLEGKNVAGALDILNGLVREAEKPNSVVAPDHRYAAYKNRGWANLLLKDGFSAEEDLNRALNVNDKGASAHCLLAKLNSEPLPPRPANLGIAREHWQKCIAFAPADLSLPAIWLIEAKRTLRGT